MSIEARIAVEKEAFRLEVDMTLPSQGVTAIFGPSGCGKTTLLRAIAGLEKGCRGQLTIDGNIWQNENTFLPPHQRPLGYVFQEPGLFAHLNVRDNVEYGLKRIPPAVRKVSLQQAIELLGIGPLLDRRVDQLSGGERQRVAIARALAVSPKILLMDEPLSALDQQRKREIMPYLQSLHNELEIPVLYVSHSPDEVAQLADHLVLLEQGKIKGEGKIADMLTRLDLPLAYGDDAEALIEARVVAHDEEFDLTYLEFPGGRFTVTRKQLPIGQLVRLRVAAKDVSLTLEHQTGTSILNIFAATVEEVSPINSAQMMVRLVVGGIPMLARVTRKSAQVLDLKPNKTLFAQTKSVALLF